MMDKFNLYFFNVLKSQYADFKGRTAKKNFWMYVLFNLVLYIIFIIIGRITHIWFLDTIYGLAILIPSVAIGIRRMHDINKSGWFILIPIYDIVLAAQDGDENDNEYGPEPITEKVV